MIRLSPLLQAFLSVEKNKTVHAAAETLFLTQTAVTQRIKQLEEKLGASLFIRSRKGMQLTEEGQVLLRYCHDMQNLENSYLHSLNMSESDNIIALKLVSSSTLMKTRIVKVVTTIAKLYPQLRLHLQIQDIEARHELLKTGQVDLAIVNNKQISKEMCTKVLSPERYVFIVPKIWAKRSIKEIVLNENIIDFDSSDDITFSYSQVGKFLITKHSNRTFFAISCPSNPYSYVHFMSKSLL
ncbi:LysR family transcriptional regulator [Cysteiniphilum sp. JM-1]|uniref:LysR family transcriptional regulator n=1 Tax=Cysteiniphilum sp. JM-1 TaxID=2610891 RepID=UPI00168CBCBD|nr:LysR family transcriptional regulator [Cysteiniphilum sp. JM-1]